MNYYDKINWKNRSEGKTTKISAERLNHMDNQIFNNANAIGNVEKIADIGDGTLCGAAETLKETAEKLTQSLGKRGLAPLMDRTLNGFDSDQYSTWLYNQVYNQNGVGYSNQITTDGKIQMWRTDNNGVSWNNVFSENIVDKLNQKKANDGKMINASSVFFGYNTESQCFDIELFMPDGTFASLWWDGTNIGYNFYDGTKIHPIWVK